MNSIGYAFNPSEHGIFVEIYLPKKAEFQGTLYQALTEGFDIEKVRKPLSGKAGTDQCLSAGPLQL